MNPRWQTSYDEIRLSGIRGRGRHGVFAEERARGQEFVVDVVLGIDIREAPRSDDLSETADYGAVAVDIHRVIEGDPVHLIETLAQRVADVCLAQPFVRVAEVVVHKPEAPIPVPFDDVAVRIVRWRPER
jgi:dihydroneopterin aldolase